VDLARQLGEVGALAPAALRRREPGREPGERAEARLGWVKGKGKGKGKDESLAVARSPKADRLHPLGGVGRVQLATEPRGGQLIKAQDGLSPKRQPFP
jgi:hypothetical protein